MGSLLDSVCLARPTFRGQTDKNIIMTRTHQFVCYSDKGLRELCERLHHVPISHNALWQPRHPLQQIVPRLGRSAEEAGSHRRGDSERQNRREGKLSRDCIWRERCSTECPAEHVTFTLIATMGSRQFVIIRASIGTRY